MSHLPDPPKPNRRKVLLVVAAVLAVLVAIGAVSALIGGNGDEGDGRDFLAEDACERMGAVLDELTAGIVTLDEARPEARKAYEDAQRSQSPTLASSSRQMLAALTAGDVNGFATAGHRFFSQCQRLAERDFGS